MGAGMRAQGWEQRLFEALTSARARPFAWGEHDCATWAFDLRATLQDAPSAADLWRGRYRTALGGARLMRKLGWGSLEEGGRTLLGEPLEDVRLAQRGDLVLGGAPEAFGVVVGAEVAFVGLAGLEVTPLTQSRLAWRT